MGGGKPSAPTVIMPAQTKPQQFQSVIPEKSFKDLDTRIHYPISSVYRGFSMMGGKSNKCRYA